MTLDHHWPDFLAAVRETGEDATPVFERLAAIVQEAIGTRLLTASVFDMEAGRSRRVFTENAAAYPVGGFKPIEANRWTEAVLVGQKIFSTTRIEEIAEVFFDWELIQSLGNESNANIPIVVGAKVIGTLNLLHEAGYYTAERLKRADELLPFATIAFLLVERAERR